MNDKSRENFRLLDLSSDQESSDLHLDIIPKKKKVTRRERNRAIAPKTSEEHRPWSELHCALTWGLRGTAVVWLLTLTWLCTSLSDQITLMKDNLTRVTVSSSGVSDALQACHTAEQNLRANATELRARIARLELQYEMLAQQVNDTDSRLRAVSGQLSAAPTLADTPRRLNELMTTIGNFGSQIKSLESSLKSAHDQVVATSSGLTEVRNLLHDVDQRSNDTATDATANKASIVRVNTDLQAVNTTLAGRVDQLMSRIDEMRPTSPVPPSTTVSTTQSSTPSTTKQMANTTTPVPPAKPEILAK